MACTKNKRRFLWMRYNGSHKEEITSIHKFMPCSSDYIVEYRCVNCGAERVRSFVTHDELLEQGITNEQIEMAKRGLWKRP